MALLLAELARHERVRRLPDLGDLRGLRAGAVDRAARARRAVYVLLGFFPLMAAMMIWPAAAGGIRRLIRLLVSVILSKLVIVAVVSMGVAAATESGASDRFEGLLVGTAMIGVACFAPMAIHRLLPLLEEAVHVRGNLSGGGAARTASSGMYAMQSAQAAAAAARLDARTRGRRRVRRPIRVAASAVGAGRCDESAGGPK